MQAAVDFLLSRGQQVIDLGDSRTFVGLPNHSWKQIQLLCIHRNEPNEHTRRLDEIVDVVYFVMLRTHRGQNELTLTIEQGIPKAYDDGYDLVGTTESATASDLLGLNITPRALLKAYADYLKSKGKGFQATADRYQWEIGVALDRFPVLRRR